MNMYSRKNALGFTLIELMIAVAIVGILSAIAYPSYTAYVVRSKRSEGKTALLAAAQNMERFFSNNNTFTTTLADAGIPAYSGDNSTNNAYTISVAAGTATGQTIANSFVITATPTARQNDPTCGNLSVDNTLKRAVSTSTDQTVINDCWK
jgi:type IV pilus assembly protein PilE